MKNLKRSQEMNLSLFWEASLASVELGTVAQDALNIYAYGRKCSLL